MKRKLLFAIVALLCSVSTWAQIDVTSKYLTNPSFETGDMTGWLYLWDNHDHASIPFAAYGTGTAEYSAFSSGGGTAAKGNYIAKMGSENWCNNYTVYQSSSVTLPAGTYTLSANLQSNANLGNYELGIVEGSVSSESKDVTFMESTSGSFAEALKGTTIEKQFTLASSTEVTFAARSSMWGMNHEFYLDDFKLYRETDVTSNITNADFSSTTGWTADASSGHRDLGNGLIGTYKVQADHAAATVDATHLATEYCLGFQARWSDGYAGYYQQISNLPAGVYTLSYDIENTNSASTNSNNYKSLFYVEVNEKKFSDSKTEWCEGKSPWTSHSIVFEIEEQSNAKISFGYDPRSLNKPHTQTPGLYVSHLKLTYSPFADAADYSELNDAIEKVEGYTLGFDAGEYASYNVLPILNAAKAIDSDENNALSTVRGLIDALNAITANAAEVNAIFDGSFEHDYSGITGNVQPLGWHRTSGIASVSGTDTGTETRYMSIPSGINVDGHTNTSQKGMMTKFHAFYGEDNGYTMPLKGNTYYTFSFLYAGWSDCNNRNLHINIYKPNGEQVSTIYPTKNISLDEIDGYTTAEHWYYYEGVFTTETEGNYLIGLIKDGGNSKQNQYGFTDFKLFRATASEIKPFLYSEIATANATYNSGANVGEGVFQIPAEAGNTFNTAINTTAQGVYDNATATVSDVVTAIDNLKTAEETYAGTTLNVPDAEKRYTLTFHCDGHDADGNILTAIHNSRADQGLYGFKYYTASANVNYAQALKFTRVSGNNYKVSFVGTDGAETYLTTATQGYDVSNFHEAIRAISDASKALEIKVIATSTANQFQLYNTLKEAVIGHNGTSNNDMFTNNSATFSIAEASQASVSGTLAAGEYATRIFPFKPSSIDDITYYTCTELSGSSLILTPVENEEDLAANTPYILYNSSESEINIGQEGYGTAKQDSYTIAPFTGFYTAQEIAAGSYVLQTQGGIQAFYKLASAATANQVYRAYLTVPSGVKPAAFFFDEGQADAISDVRGQMEDGRSEIFNLVGQRVNKAQKGLYIINGKKVLVK